MMEEEKTQVPPRRRGYRHKENCPCGLCRNISRGQSNAQRALSVRDSGGQLRRKRFVNAFTDPSSGTFANGKASAISAGYSEAGATNTAARLLLEPEVQKGVIAAHEKIGINADFLSRKLKQALEAKVKRLETQIETAKQSRILRNILELGERQQEKLKREPNAKKKRKRKQK